MFAIFSPIESWRETAPLLLSQILLQRDLIFHFSLTLSLKCRGHVLTAVTSCYCAQVKGQGSGVGGSPQ